MGCTENPRSGPRCWAYVKVQAQKLTNKLIESPLSLFPGHIEDNIAREHRVGDAKYLALKAADGGPVPANVNHNALHDLSTASPLCQLHLCPAVACIIMLGLLM